MPNAMREYAGNTCIRRVVLREREREREIVRNDTRDTLP